MASLNHSAANAPRWIPATAQPPAATRRLSLVPQPAGDRASEDLAGVRPESSWREAPGEGLAGEVARISARRWKENCGGEREYSAAPDPRFALIGVALRPTEARLTVGGACVHDGPVPAGFAGLSAPGQAAQVCFRGPCDILHLFVPAVRLAEIAGEPSPWTAPDGSARPWLGAADAVIERLAWLLLNGGPGEAWTSGLYLDGIAVAIVSRLLDCSRAGDAQASRGLVRWRLKRVQNFIEEQLSERLSLADLARSAGLSRMHFAAQFRAATGMRPHEYLVRRRIQKAQEMLLATSMPLVEVALSVGFQTQAHFTTVFRRFLGETPGRWREAQRLG